MNRPEAVDALNHLDDFMRQLRGSVLKSLLPEAISLCIPVE
jgi:hypothetical protein